MVVAWFGAFGCGAGNRIRLIVPLRRILIESGLRHEPHAGASREPRRPHFAPARRARARLRVRARISSRCGASRRSA